MPRNPAIAIYVAAMIVLIVLADVLFFRDRTTARLIANAAIVAAFALCYFVFIRKR
jgi:hypothetical protein